MAAAACSFLTLLLAPAHGWWDFSVFYAAGRFAFSSALSLMTPIVDWQRAAELPIAVFAYPPVFALPYVPLAALPYHIAAALNVALMTAAVMVAALLGARIYGLPARWLLLGSLAWLPVGNSVATGQNATLLLLLATVALALCMTRPVIAGVTIGLITFKPQFAFAPIVAFSARARRRGLLGLVIAGALVYGGSALASGDLLWPRAWYQGLTVYNSLQAGNDWQAVSLFTILNVPTPLAAIASCAAISVLLFVAARRLTGLPELMAVALAAGVVLGPHALVYDATLLLPGLAVLAQRATRAGWPDRLRWSFAAMYLAAFAYPLGKFGVQPLLLVGVAIIAAILWWHPRATERADS